MTNKLVVTVNSLKVPKIKKILPSHFLSYPKCVCVCVCVWHVFCPRIAFVCKSRSYQSTENSYFGYSQKERSPDFCVFVNIAIFSIILTEFVYCATCVAKMSTALTRPDLPHFPRPEIETCQFWGAHKSRFTHFVALTEDGGICLLLICLLSDWLTNLLNYLLNYLHHGAESLRN